MKSMQDCHINAGVPKGRFLGPFLFMLYMSNLDDVICNFAICFDDATLESTLDVWVSDLYQPQLHSELECDFRNTFEYGRK